MDVFSMFRNGQTPTPQVPDPNAGGGGNPNAGGTPNSGGNGDAGRNAITPNASGSNTPNNGAPNGQQEKSPLADFADLWKNEPVKDGQQPQTDWFDPKSVLPQTKLDPKKLYESAQRIDFAKAMPKEKVEAALKGDHQAFSEVMNSVAQYAYANMAMSTTRIVEAMMGQMAPKMFEALPHHIRKHVVNEAVDSSDPIFKNPAVAPMLESMKEQLRVKYPTASAKEIQEKAQQYVKEFAQAVGGKAGASSAGSSNQPGNGRQQASVQEENWDDFLKPVVN